MSRVRKHIPDGEHLPTIKAAETWLKDASADIRNERFAPIADKARQFESSPDVVKSIMNEGSEKARDTARDTLHDVRQALGLLAAEPRVRVDGDRGVVELVEAGR